MTSDRLISTSKFLSLVLRHQPEKIGLELDPEGWASIDDLISRANAARPGRPLSADLIREVVATSDKQRFAISADGLSIRANQGHSISVDLGLEAEVPPEFLYHGTATRFLPSIRDQGLLPQNRQYVHLSADEATATRVGQRHGKPVVLAIPARSLHNQGHRFWMADNGVWLTEAVPAEAIEFDSDQDVSSPG